jgi:hypothetical protein
MNTFSSATLPYWPIPSRCGPAPATPASQTLSWRMIGHIEHRLTRLLVPAAFPVIRTEAMNVALELSERTGCVVTIGYVGPLIGGHGAESFRAAFGAMVDTLERRFEREACFTDDWVDGVASLAAYVRADLIVGVASSPAMAGLLAVAATTLQLPFYVGLPMEGGL